VVDLLLVPRFVFSLSCIERRIPLGSTARRHGHVLCNILLGSIPSDAKIPIVTAGRAASSQWVREKYARLRPLENLKLEARGWTLDVLNFVRGLGKAEFTLGEVYAQEAALARLHPDNLHVRDKIRQQLQRLRDLGFIEFAGRGHYRLT
ncbi:MAG: DpnI domain-containing protein, partial [Terriglobales bacterium]